MFQNGTDFRLGYQVGCVKKNYNSGDGKVYFNPHFSS